MKRAAILTIALCLIATAALAGGKPPAAKSADQKKSEKVVSDFLTSMDQKKYDAAFVNGMKEAKRISAATGGSLRTILHETLGVRPRRLDPEFLAAAARMYTDLTTQATGLTIFGRSADLHGVLDTFRKFGVA